VVQGKKAGQLVDVRSVDEFTGKDYRASGMTETAQRRAGQHSQRR